MCPTIYIGNGAIHPYGLMAGVGIIAVLFASNALGRRRGMPPWDILLGMPWMVLGGLVGASVLYAITNAGYLAGVLADFASYQSAWALVKAVAAAFSGMVFYGGLFGALSGMLLWLRATHRPSADYLDVAAVATPLFHMFARVGCFLGGCCFGVECPVGFVYTENPVAWANGTVRFPVQLLEAACEAVLFFVILRLFNRGRYRGHLLAVWFAAYPVVRFLDEFLRGDYYRGFLGPFSTSQWISLAILAVVAVWALRRHCLLRGGSRG